MTINATGHRSEFVYDGLGRRVQIIEKDPDATQTLQTTSDKKYLWVGTTIAEERTGDDGGTVTKRFFSQGFVDSDGTILLYTRDHLGSIRELVDMQQNVRARYEYDPYGNVTKVSGDRDSVFLYTGHFWHSQSGLYLALFRAYDPELGRWLSRDPKAEGAGLNMYAYVRGNPVYFHDRLGLDVWDNIGNFSAGLGDGIFLVLTLGYTDASALREMLGIDGAVNKCSSAYRWGKGTGVAASIAAIAAVGAVAAINSIGEGMAEAAMGSLDQSVEMFRAVGVGEFESIDAAGEFLSGEGFMGKQFGLAFGETLQFSSWASDTVAIVGTSVPLTVAMQFEFSTGIDATIFRSGVITVQQELLPLLNETVQWISHVF